MKLILRDAARSDAGKSHPSPMASATPTVQTNSRRLPSNRWRVFRNRRALRLHLSEQCRPISRQCGLLHACDKKMAHRPNIAHAFPAAVHVAGKKRVGHRELCAGRHARVVAGLGRYRSGFVVVRFCQHACCARIPVFPAM